MTNKKLDMIFELKNNKIIIGKTTSTKFQNEMYKNHAALKRNINAV